MSCCHRKEYKRLYSVISLPENITIRTSTKVTLSANKAAKKQCIKETSQVLRYLYEVHIPEHRRKYMLCSIVPAFRSLPSAWNCIVKSVNLLEFLQIPNAIQM